MSTPRAARSYNWRHSNRSRTGPLRRLACVASISWSLIVATGGCSLALPGTTRIRQTLDEQQAAWNRGDIDGFMEGYVRSNELTFSSGGKTLRGWAATRDRYRAKYDTRAKMGSLEFSDLEIRPLDQNVALVLGRWRLRRQDGSTPGGNYSLVMIRSGDRWLILHDHTSSDEPAAAPTATGTAAAP